MNCTGTELSLANCSFSSSTANCPASHLASAVCYKTNKAQVDTSKWTQLSKHEEVSIFLLETDQVWWAPDTEQNLFVSEDEVSLD